MFLIGRDSKFVKKATKFFKKHPDLASKFKEIIIKLENNPFEPSLRFHQLKGNLSKFHAISLTYEYRIVLLLKIVDEEIILVDIGTHDEVY